MSHLNDVRVPRIETLQVSIQPPDKLRLAGSLTMRDPGKDLSGFFRSLHDAAMADRLTDLHVDITGLTFVNSSSIRLFVDWTTWLQPAPKDGRYMLRFRASRHLTWQKACFSALISLAGAVVAVEYAE